MRVYDQIDAYRILSYKELQDYLNERLVSTSFDDCRLGRILLKLSSLSDFDTNIIEEIFFVGLIGMLILNVPFYASHALLPHFLLQVQCKFIKSFHVS